MPKQRRSLPPVSHFVDGGVWRIRVDHRAEGIIWRNATTEPRYYLVMVRAGIKGKRWTRTRLAVGDLEKRKKEDIYKDFVALKRQSPPVTRNYRAGLSMDRGDPIEWLDYEGSIQ